MRVARAAPAVLLVLVLAVLSGGPASAHDALVSSDPADGATVATAPPTIDLVYTQPLLGIGTQVLVRDPAGNAVSAGPARLVDSTVSQDLGGDLPPGTYSVQWRVTSGDGHPISGELTFTAEAAGSGAVSEVPVTADAPPVGPQDGGGVPPGLWLVVVAGVVLTGVLLLRRRPPRGPASDRTPDPAAAPVDEGLAGAAVPRT
ncbi:MAG: copper resistance protein CopC [Actinotalea sp.]|nr:copper resistance protein CopC [Actinotalea sp.]